MIDTTSSSERPRLEPRLGWLWCRDEERMGMRQSIAGMCCSRAGFISNAYPAVKSMTLLKIIGCLLAWRSSQTPII